MTSLLNLPLLKSKNASLFVILIFLLLLTLSACVYYYPLSSDDFNYSYTMTEEKSRVINFIDVLEGTKVCFFDVNGRTFSNFMVFLFVNLVPQIGMFVLAFITLGLTIVIIVKNTKCATIFPYLFPLFLILCPSINNTVYWKTGFMNYALPGMFNVLWKWLFMNCKNFQSQNYFVILSVFVGTLHEGVSLPFSASLFFYLLINRNNTGITEKKMSIAYNGHFVNSVNSCNIS